MVLGAKKTRKQGFREGVSKRASVEKRRKDRTRKYRRKSDTVGKDARQSKGWQKTPY